MYELDIGYGGTSLGGEVVLQAFVGHIDGQILHYKTRPFITINKIISYSIARKDGVGEERTYFRPEAVTRD